MPAIAFDVGMAHMWWSHVGKERRQEFLSLFVSRLEPRAVILMIDQVSGGCSSVSRQDEWGNLMTLRTLEGNVPAVVELGMEALPTLSR